MNVNGVRVKVVIKEDQADIMCAMRFGEELFGASSHSRLLTRPQQQQALK